MTQQIEVQYIKTSIGELVVGSYQEQLCLLDFRYRKMRSAVDRRLQLGLKADVIEKNNISNDLAITQLNEYLTGERTEFDLPLKLVGSTFQLSVWNALLELPYGTTASYLDLAKKIGDANAVRAVASANGANAIAIVVPCHRIIGADGSLTGYGGGLPLKKKLLTLETPDLFSAA